MITNLLAGFVPALLGLIVLVALIIWVAVAVRGTARVLGIVGLLVLALSRLTGVAFSTFLPALVQRFHLSSTSAALAFNVISLIISSIGTVLVVAAIVSAARARR